MDGSVEVIESFLSDDRGNFSGCTKALITFIDHNAARSLLDRLDQSLFVEGSERPRVNDFCGDALVSQTIRRLQGNVHHTGGRDYGDVGSASFDVGAAEGNRVVGR